MFRCQILALISIDYMGLSKTVRVKKKKSLNGLVELPITPFLSTSHKKYEAVW